MNNNIENDFFKIEQEFLSKWNETLESGEKCENLEQSYKNAIMRTKMYDKKSKLRRLSREILKISAVAASILLIVSALLKYTLHITSYEDVVGTICDDVEIVSLYAPNGKTTTITLSDSTKVILNSGSALIYPKTFGSNSREIHLVGEAYFSVAKDEKRPFTVHTPYMKVKALGTIFTVKAYQKDETESATLLSGSIKVTPNDTSIPSKILTPDEQLVLSHDGKYCAVFNVNSKQDASWTEGKIIFLNTPFEDVIDRLECQFGTTIYYDKEHYGRQLVVAKFIHNESLTDILDMLQTICKFKYSCNENRCIIYNN